jgi:hypothetical protein
MVSAGAIAPKDPEDRTQYVLFVEAQDDAGLRGGGGAAGVEPAELGFAVDFTPVSVLDSVRAVGTTHGCDWNGSANVDLPPVDTAFTWDDFQQMQPDSFIILPRNSNLTLYWRATDPEDGCISGVRWAAQGGVFGSGNTVGPWTGHDQCVGDTSRGALATELVASGPLINPVKMWVRARDSYLRMEEPGPGIEFLINYVPTVTIDSVVEDPGTGNVTIRWHGTDRDDDEQDIRFQISLDGGSRELVGAVTFRTYLDAELDPGISQHRFEIRASNNFDSGRFVEADTTFTIN